MRGLVTKSTGSWYEVLTDDGRNFKCRIKGKFRTMDIKTTNPIAVGDWVDIRMETEDEAGTAVIVRLYDRQNYIIRKSINLSKQAQIIAANLDQAILVVTLVSPFTSLGFVDRFLVTAEAYGVPAALIFNKVDLLSKEGLAILHEYQEVYESLGYPCYQVSALNGLNIDTINGLLQNKTTLLSGHSGVGKSTLINAVHPSAKMRTGEISEWSDKGKHTTTFAEMILLPFGGRLIDTPGIRELGIIGIEPHELGHFFPEMRALMNECRFNDCQHINEPGCAVLAALESGGIAPSRYESYFSIYYGNDTRA